MTGIIYLKTTSVGRRSFDRKNYIFKFLDVTPDGFAVTVGFVLSMSISRQGGRWVVKLKVVRPGKHKHKHKRWTVDLGTENLGTRIVLEAQPQLATRNLTRCMQGGARIVYENFRLSKASFSRARPGPIHRTVTARVL
ncbi:unnamed protein product [Victoria cruziana]